MALQAAMDSTTQVAVTKLRMASRPSSAVAAAQPAEAKAAGSARAPVPTIRLKMKTAAVAGEKLPPCCTTAITRYSSAKVSSLYVFYTQFVICE